MRSKRAEVSELRTRLVLAGIVVVVMILLASSKDSMVRGAANRPVAGERELITRVNPDYPAAVKAANLGGVVRVQAVVAPDGTVRTIQLLQGDLLLGESAMRAIRQWKYAPAATDETLTMKIEFDSHR